MTTNDIPYHMITFQLNHCSKTYHSLVMNFKENTTTLWFQPAGPQMKSFNFQTTWKETTPQTALQLADRIKNLAVFS